MSVVLEAELLGELGEAPVVATAAGGVVDVAHLATAWVASWSKVPNTTTAPLFSPSPSTQISLSG